MEYLTTDDYMAAMKNGVNFFNMYNRCYVLGWSKEKAISTPVNAVKGGRKRGIWYQYKEKAEANGIAKSTFYYRVKKGLSPERAVAFPPTVGKPFIIEKEIEKNGIHRAGRY